MYEKKPAKAAKIKKGIIPIYSTRSGKLKIPVPIALASKVKMIPLKEPSFIGLKALLIKPFLTYSYS